MGSTLVHYNANTTLTKYIKQCLTAWIHTANTKKTTTMQIGKKSTTWPDTKCMCNKTWTWWWYQCAAKKITSN